MKKTTSMEMTLSPRWLIRRGCVLVCVAAAWLVGCDAPTQAQSLHTMGQPMRLAQARVALQKRLAQSQSPMSDKDYLLDRMRLLILGLADGYPQVVQKPVEQLFEMLTTHGLNRDKELDAMVFHEGVRIWKGEPFEQAMAFHYIGTYYAMMGSWDNVRAATLNSLSQLRDFSQSPIGRAGGSIDADALAARARALEDGSPDVKKSFGKASAGRSGQDHGYTPVKNDFVLGYLMGAIANQRLASRLGDHGRALEAADQFREVLRLKPQLKAVVGRLQAEAYNTLLIVDAGQGPRKVRTGPDGTLTDYQPVTQSDAPLRVRVGRVHDEVPVACDLNRLATNHIWRGREGARLAKSTVGTGLMIAGAAVSNSRNQDAQWAGLGLLLAGLYAKATAGADTRYCQLLPQRVYVAPVTLSDPGQTIALQVAGKPGTRLVLAGLSRPARGRVQVRYVRLLDVADPPAWAVSGQVKYDADVLTRHPKWRGRDCLPYILGGRSLRKPTWEILSDWRQAGLPVELDLGGLTDLFAAEGIGFDDRSTVGIHVLEGGKTLQSPLPGTLGFARLFGQDHPAYVPRSPQLRQWRQRLTSIFPLTSISSSTSTDARSLQP